MQRLPEILALPGLLASAWPRQEVSQRSLALQVLHWVQLAKALLRAGGGSSGTYRACGPINSWQHRETSCATQQLAPLPQRPRFSSLASLLLAASKRHCSAEQKQIQVMVLDRGAAPLSTLPLPPPAATRRCLPLPMPHPCCRPLWLRRNPTCSWAPLRGRRNGGGH